MRPIIIWKAIHHSLLAIVGGYLVSAATARAIAVALVMSGALPRSEAATAASMAAFVVYLGVALWAFAEHRAWRIWVGFTSIIVVSLGVVAALTPALVDQGGAV
ncbi:MAG: iron transporter [Myxococcota bacterium]